LYKGISEDDVRSFRKNEKTLLKGQKQEGVSKIAGRKSRIDGTVAEKPLLLYAEQTTKN
jgi:hypothetical protein